MDAILEERPFRHRLALAGLEALEEEGAHSGTAFLATAEDGTRYKLRRCGSVHRARRIERYVAALPGLFPKLIARDRRFLLFEYLADHERLSRRELLRAADDIGELSARLHREGARFARAPVRHWVAWRYQRRLRRDLRLLGRSGQLSAPELRRLRSKLRARRRRFGLPIALELDDVHKGNLMRAGPGGALRYVDEEGIGLRPRGLALATLLKTATYSRALVAFRRGYGREGSAAWIDDAYLEYLLLLDAVRRVSHKLRFEQRLEKLPEDLVGLRAMAASPEVQLDWRFPKDRIQKRRLAARMAKGITAAAGWNLPIAPEDRPTPRELRGR